MKKLLITLLIAATAAHGAITLNDASFNSQSQQWVYDITASFEDNKFVEGWPNPEYTSYYETFTISSAEGGDYIFDNYGSKLSKDGNPIYDTQLLIYETMPTNILFNAPRAFLNTETDGFGPGTNKTLDDLNSTRELLVDINGNPIEPIVDVSPTGFQTGAFYGTITLEADTEYIVAISSFEGGYGSVDFMAMGDSQLNINNTIPEPATVGLIGAAAGALLLARKRREF